MTQKEKLDTFIATLKNRDDVVAVILFGSFARGNNRPDSDIDLVVILKDGYARGAEYFEGQAFEIIYVTEKGAVEFWQNNKHDAVGLWEVAQILFDRDGTGERLKQVGNSIRAEKRPSFEVDPIVWTKFRPSLDGVAG
jgi:predicted nucleotidyltransferase